MIRKQQDGLVINALDWCYEREWINTLDWLNSQLCHSIFLSPWASHVISLHLNSLSNEDDESFLCLSCHLETSGRDCLLTCVCIVPSTLGPDFGGADNLGWNLNNDLSSFFLNNIFTIQTG